MHLVPFKEYYAKHEVHLSVSWSHVLQFDAHLKHPSLITFTPPEDETITFVYPDLHVPQVVASSQVLQPPVQAVQVPALL